MEEETEESSKFELCVLRTQIGKTYIAIQRIDEEINQDGEFGRSMHIVFTMNTLLNNAQFAKRLQSIEDTYGKGSVCIFSSQRYVGTYKHVKNRLALQGICLDESTCPRVIVMCSNKRRYDDGLAFIKVLNENKTNISRAFAYFDELHNYITPTLRSQIEQMDKLDIIINIMALTATPDPIWKPSGYWSKLQLSYFDEYNESNYAGCKDMIFNCIDDCPIYPSPYIRPGYMNFKELDRHTIGFVEYTLNEHSDIINGVDKLIFIPGHRRRVGHNRIRDMVFRHNKNAVVVMINGADKNIQFKDQFGSMKTLSLISPDEEVCETISRLLIKHELHNRVKVITGFLCVGMGQTLMHKSIGTFTHAILGHMDLSNNEIYQLIGRLTGRIKDWGDKYIQTQVYCPTPIMNRCCVIEKCDRELLIEHNGEIVSQEVYRKPMYVMGDEGKSAIENIRTPKEKRIPKIKEKKEPIINKFTNYEDAREYAKTFSGKRGPNKIPESRMKDGFYHCVVRKIQKVWSVDEMYIDRKCNITNGANYGFRYCYRDTNDKSTLEFWIVHY